MLSRCLPARDDFAPPPQPFKERILASIDSTRMFLRLLGTSYYTVTLPLRLAFEPDYKLSWKESPLLHTLDLVFTVIFFIEIVVTYRLKSSAIIKPSDEESASVGGAELSAHPSGQNSMGSTTDAAAVDNTEDMTLPLLSLAFVVDVLSTLPLEYLYPILHTSFPNTPFIYYHANRLLRTTYLPLSTTELTIYLTDSGRLKNVGIHRAWKLFGSMAMAGHWCACLFFLVATNDLIAGFARSTSHIVADNTIPETWPVADGLCEVRMAFNGTNETFLWGGTLHPEKEPVTSYTIVLLASTSQCYIRSLYWAYITMVTTGFGDIVPLTVGETKVTILSMYIGALITTCAIANLQLLVTNMDAARTNFQLKMDALKMYMLYRRLPLKLQNRITSFYDYQWDLLKGANEQEFLNELPKSLQQQVANFMSRDLIKTLPLLRKANNALLNALTDCVESNIYSPNDEILRPGEQVKGALLVSRGEVEVLKGVNVERKLQRFDRFAEESLFVKTVSENLVKSKTFCEIFLLPSEDFMRIVTAQCDTDHIKQMKEAAEKAAGQNSKANKMFGSADEAVPMSGFKKHCYPESKFRRMWGWVMFLGIVYYIFFIPLSVMYCMQGRDRTFSHMIIQLSFGYLFDLIFLLDLVLDSTFFMYVEEGLVVFDHERIRDNFFAHNSLPREVASAIPWDVLGIFISHEYINVFLVCRFTKILRLSKVFKYMDYAEKLLVEAQFGVDQAARRVLKLMFLMVAVCHWIGCFWYMMADLSDWVYKDIDGDMMWRGATQTNWRDADEQDPLFDILHDDMGEFSAWLRSIYWAIVSLSTVGYGDVIPQNILETVFATLAVLGGGLVLPAIVGGLAAYMGNLNQASNIHKKKMYKVRTFMRTTRFPRFLVDKILRYYDYLWSRQGGVDEVEIMNELPGPLQQRVAMVVSGEALSNIPFFEHCDEGMQQYLVSMLNPRVFLPGDTIIQSGEVGKEMYLIERGLVIVSNDDKTVSYGQLSDGDYFGETCLVGATTRMATVYAVTYCDCFVLTKDDFNEVMGAYLPKERTDISDAVAQELQSKINKNRAVNTNFSDLPKCLQRTFNSKVDKDADDVKMSLTARINPDSAFRNVWNFVILIVCIYNGVAVPSRMCFLDDKFSNYYFLDWTLDLLFIVDFYLNMNEFSYVHMGELVTRRDQVRANYLQGNFKADLATMFPLDLFALAFIGDLRKTILCLTVTRIPKLIRLSRVVATASDLSRAVEDTNVPLGPIQLAKLAVAIMFISHWAGCIFHAFANYRWNENDCEELQALQDAQNKASLADANMTTCRILHGIDGQGGRNFDLMFTESGGVDACGSTFDFIEGLENRDRWAEAFGTGGFAAADAYTYCKWGRTWIQKQIEEGKLDMTGGTPMERYLRAFNWALPTLVVVVIGDVVPITTAETLYAFLLMVLGVTINATIVGNVANLVANLENDSSEFVKKADDIKHFMHMHHVHASLVDRVEKFMSYLWTAHGGATNEWDFIGELPHTLQMAVSNHTRLKYVKDCPFFDFCSNEIIAALAMCLNPMMFSMGDVLVQYNDMGQEMYFLEKGAVEVVSGDGKVVFATLQKGAFFGETALFFKQKRSATIRAVEFCEVFQLEKKDLDNELRQREFDLTKMLGIFTGIADSNSRRNSSMAKNLKASKVEGTKLFKMIDSNDDTARQGKKVRAIFLPNSKFRAYWDICLMLFSVWFAVSILLRIALVLPDSVDGTVGWLAIDFFMDLCFVVDMYLNFTCFPFILNGTVVSEQEAIRSHYLKGWFGVDMLACLPLELLVPILGLDKSMLFQLRLVHMFRLVRLGQYFRDCDHYLNLWNIRISAATSQLMIMFAYYILLNHWCACVWFIIHRYAEPDVKMTWATQDCPQGHCLAKWDEETQTHDICSRANGFSVSDCYTRAFFFVITTISTVGYGDIAPQTPIETIWEDTVVLLGACIFAGIIGCFTAFLSQNDTSGPNAFKLKLQKLAEYMKYRNLPLDLQTSILLHHKHRWSKSQIMNEKFVMEILPLPLQLDLSFAVVWQVVKNVPILSECSSIMQKRIAHSFTVQTCPPQSFIYEAGDIGWDIYFIGSGLIKVMLPKNLNVLDLAGRAASGRAKRKADSIGNLYRIGNHFGESCLTSMSGVRQESAEARTLAELYLLAKDDMDLICSYMVGEDREKFRNNLTSRNGNVRHTFGEDDDDDEEELQAVNALQKSEQLAGDTMPLPGGKDTRSPMSIVRARKPRSSLEGDSEGSGGSKSGNPYGVKQIRRKTLGLAKPPRDLVRLRSFSAEASKEAIKNSPSGPGAGAKKKSSNAFVLGGEGICEIGRKSDAREAASLIQQMAAAGVNFNGAAKADGESSGSSSESGSDDEGGEEKEGGGTGLGAEVDALNAVRREVEEEKKAIEEEMKLRSYTIDAAAPVDVSTPKVVEDKQGI